MDEEIKKLVDALEAQGNLSADLTAKLDALTDAQLKQAEAAAKSAEVTKDKAVTALEQEIKFREKATQTLELQESAIKKKMETMSVESEVAKAKVELIEIQIQKLELLAKAEEGNTEEILKSIEALKEQREELDKTAKEISALEDEFAKLGKSIGKTLAGSTVSIDSILNPQNLVQMTQALKNVGGKTLSLAGAMNVFSKSMGPAALANFISNIAKLAVELGNGEASFIRATNASEDFARNITHTYEEGRKFAATSKDMFASATALTRGFTDFTFQSKEAQRMIVTNTAALNKMGLSNQAVASSLQLMTKSFGMTGKQGVKQLANLEKFSENLGVPLEKLGSDFQSAGGDLAKLGDNGMEAFKGLAKTMKVTGLEMNKILNLTRQFDTFEGAARSAGKLNAALGGNFVNAMDLMMETDPSERLNMMRDAILDTGLSFDEMSYYQRNFYKDALGLGDVSELAALLSGDMDDVTSETMKSSQELKELREQARLTASFQEQLNAVFAQAIPILTPLIDGLRSLITSLSENIGLVKMLGAAFIGFSTGGPIGALVGLLVGAASSMDDLGEQTTVLGSFISGLLFPFQAIAVPIRNVWDLITGWMSSLSESGEGMSEFAETAKMLGRIIGYVLAGAMILLIAPIGTLTAKLLAVGGVVLSVIGYFSDLGKKLFKEQFASTFLDGIIKLANAFGSIAEKVLPILNPITLLKKLVSQLGDTFTQVLDAISGSMSEIGVFVDNLSTSLTGVIDSMLTGISSLMQNISTAMSGVVDSVASFFNVLTAPEAAQNIQDIAAAITAIPTTKNLEFVASMTAAAGMATLDSAATSVKAMGTAAASAVGDIFKTENKTENVTNIQQANKEPQEITVNLMVDRDKLATVVQKINGDNTQNYIANRG